MAEKGIFTVAETESIAKFFDSLVDFNELLGDKKVLLVVNLGKILEKNDDALIGKLITYVDDVIVEDKVSDELKDILIATKNFIVAKDIEGLTAYLSPVLAENVSFLSSDEAEERIIYGALTMLSGLLTTIVNAAAERFSKGVAEAEAEGDDTATETETETKTE